MNSTFPSRVEPWFDPSSSKTMFDFLTSRALRNVFPLFAPYDLNGAAPETSRESYVVLFLLSSNVFDPATIRGTNDAPVLDESTPAMVRESNDVLPSSSNALFLRTTVDCGMSVPPSNESVLLVYESIVAQLVTNIFPPNESFLDFSDELNVVRIFLLVTNVFPPNESFLDFSDESNVVRVLFLRLLIGFALDVFLAVRFRKLFSNRFDPSLRESNFFLSRLHLHDSRESYRVRSWKLLSNRLDLFRRESNFFSSHLPSDFFDCRVDSSPDPPTLHLTLP